MDVGGRPSCEHRRVATRSPRLGVVGIVSLALLAGLAVLVFIRVTSAAQPARRCAGGGATPAGVSGDDPAAAIRAFAPQAVAPSFIGEVGALPADGWIRRSDTLYEHDVDAGRRLQIDVAPSSGGRSTVVGVWLCTPVGTGGSAR
jgi:hypothetical protein